MKFTMSPNIGLITNDLSGAGEFYTQILGFKKRSKNDKMWEIDASPLNLFIMEGKPSLRPVMELFVDDLEAAKNFLIQNGCKILRWEGKGGNCYVQDPFGMVFNIWEQ